MTVPCHYKFELRVSIVVNWAMRPMIALLLLLPATSNADYIERQLGETGIRIEIDHELDRSKAAELADWVLAGAETVTQVYGRFPTDRLRVILRQEHRFWWSRRSAVYFGRTTRDDGGTVELYIDPDQPMDDFYADWTATHEFSHLMLPLLDREDRWFSEGFATYYQNVLMARAGRYTPEYAWQRLAAGFERGRDSRPELSPNEVARRGARNARMKYYWAGAAVALMIDVELRTRSNGAESLDTVLDELEACCLPARWRWSGPELMRQLDSFLDEPLFVDYWRRYADRPGFPAVDEILNSARYSDTRARIMRKTFP